MIIIAPRYRRFPKSRMFHKFQRVIPVIPDGTFQMNPKPSRVPGFILFYFLLYFILLFYFFYFTLFSAFYFIMIIFIGIGVSHFFYFIIIFYGIGVSFFY